MTTGRRRASGLTVGLLVIATWACQPRPSAQSPSEPLSDERTKLERSRALLVEEMVQEAEIYRYEPCGPSTDCHHEIERFRTEINRIDRALDALDPTRQAWHEGVPGLVDPRETPEGTSAEYLGDPRRDELHDRLVARRLAAAQEDDETPEAILTMGGPGSGKSTVLELLDLCGDGWVHIDSDAFKQDLVEYQIAVAARDRLASDRVHPESSALAKSTRRRAVESGRDFCFDGTLKRKRPTLELIGSLQAAGYEVTVVGALLPVATGLERVAARAELTGRFVPTEFVRAAYDAIDQHAEEVVLAADEGFLYDTDVPWGDEPKLLAHAVKGTFVEDARTEQDSSNR